MGQQVCARWMTAGCRGIKNVRAAMAAMREGGYTLNCRWIPVTHAG